MEPLARLCLSFVRDALAWWVLSHIAQSYLEPGTRSFLLKILVSFLAGAVLVIRHFRNGIRSLLARLPSRTEKQESSRP